ncbi:unnamed protein product [Cladocopium goreaui]|uniref:Uncharacterized protein n=1 Tax=Cladocopium goreaui TaxID=2562237 RepID=A0A9P1GFS0_9DINO|nr:unnamed protein product [Cladocopium goreaui]
MPIDYSKFENIEDDLDGDEWRQMLEQLSREVACNDPLSPPSRFGDEMGMDLGFDPGYEMEDPGFEEYEPLDFPELRDQALQLILRRCTTSPFPAKTLPRRLLLEAELRLRGRQHREALLCSLALRLAVGSEEDLPELPETPPSTDQEQLPAECWLVPAAVIEMVCAYQLGDRNHAVRLRDALVIVDRSILSKHLTKRFNGTAEVLDFVPQFLNLLNASGSY